MSYSHGRVKLHILEGRNHDGQLLYLPDMDRDHAIVRRGSFPRIKLKLSLQSKLLLEGNHHSINQVGLRYLSSMLDDSLNKILDHGSSSVTCSQVVSLGVLRIELALPVHTYPRLVERGEDLFAFARRVGADPFLISHLNGHASYMTVAAGQSVMVPMFYGSKLKLDLNMETHLPVRLEIFDSHGEVYERYQWLEFQQLHLDETTFDGDKL